MSSTAHIRQLAGVLLLDLPRFVRALRADGDDYLALCNRNERLEPSPDGTGFRCDWAWTSDLHAPKYLPTLGLHIARRALAQHPIRRLASPERTSKAPQVTFIIGHRGNKRLPHLLATLESIAGQRDAPVECLVVEQDEQSRIAGQLPEWVRYLHTPPPAADMPYCRSWAFNIGARHASTGVLVLHDNDILVPDDYASRLLERVGHGYDVVNLKRFIFYLSEPHTKAVLSGTAGLTTTPPLSIVQNLEGGGSIAITRLAYDQIGGMDESFIGWGGEDNEFWDRAQTLKIWRYASLPLVHLWHSPQARKHTADNPTLRQFASLSAIPADTRIVRLRSTSSGKLSSPTGWKP